MASRNAFLSVEDFRRLSHGSDLKFFVSGFCECFLQSIFAMQLALASADQNEKPQGPCS